MGDSFTSSLLSEQAHRTIERDLAKLSEDQNYLKKNRYRLDKTLIEHADKKRMPIDEQKVHYLLKNRPTFNVKILDEIHTHENLRNNSQFEHGLLSYLSDAAYGEMRDLLKEVGIVNENL